MWVFEILQQILCCAERKGTVGERKEKYIQVQASALHFDFFCRNACTGKCIYSFILCLRIRDVCY